MTRAKKSLGQNFLKSKSIARDIASAAKINPGEKVLEIGPGKGILTEALLESGAEVIAVEKDKELANFLRKKFEKEIKNSQLTLVEKDIRDFNVSDYVLRSTFYKLVSNIPYYITGELLRRFLSSDNQPQLLVFLIQKEVAQRIVGKATPGDRPRESVLSISVKAYGNPTYVKKVSKRYFSPAPKVDSAILKVEDISKSFFSDLDEDWFFKVLKTGFAHKRKKLAGNLGEIAEKEFLKEIFSKLGISENARAEELDVNQWKSLAKELRPSNNKL